MKGITALSISGAPKQRCRLKNKCQIFSKTCVIFFEHTFCKLFNLNDYFEQIRRNGITNKKTLKLSNTKMASA